jgi:hypothetical protein
MLGMDTPKDSFPTQRKKQSRKESTDYKMMNKAHLFAI